MGWIEWLRDAAEHNQFFSGVAGVSLLGGALYWLRSLPTLAWNWIVWAFSIEIEISNDSVLFDPIERWVADRADSWHTRSFMVVAANSQGRAWRRQYVPDDGDDDVMGWMLAPGRGTSWIRHGGWIYRVHREITNESTTNSSHIRQTLYIRTPGWTRARITTLLDDARASLMSTQSLAIHVWRTMSWMVLDRRAVRPLESLVMRPGLIEDVVADVEAFRSREAWYVERGLPYRRGYFFIGGPGCGKSSLAMALAGHFQLPLYVLNLGSLMSDDSLIDAVAEVPARAVLLIEDVDATGAAAKRDPGQAADKQDKLTLSALLNCVDGAVAKDGRLLVMTSNHPELVDPALLRPGRVDKTIYFPPAGPDEAARLFARFFPAEPGLGRTVRQGYQKIMSAAEIQEACLGSLEDPEAAVTSITNRN